MTVLAWNCLKSRYEAGESKTLTLLFKPQAHLCRLNVGDPVDGGALQEFLHHLHAKLVKASAKEDIKKKVALGK